jgi:hypothetical protein
VAVVGGLLSAMLLTLFLVPCLYVIVQNATAALSRLLTGGKREAVKAEDSSDADADASPTTA